MLNEDVIGIRPVIKLGAKRRLPLLRLHGPMSVRIVRDEAFKVEFAYARDLGASLKIRVRKITNAIGPLQKSHRGIEVRANLSMLAEKIKPVRSVDDSRPKIGLAPMAVTGIQCAQHVPGTAGLGRESIERQILPQHQPPIHTFVLVVIPRGIS